MGYSCMQRHLNTDHSDVVHIGMVLGDDKQELYSLG